ncbi:hypothetical protein C8J57DRAFT_1110514 [Mycena rebaudengoi]|nr:hypothetical protein C8J57DRAFT_1110514 [Mycena rebaudengoi]
MESSTCFPHCVFARPPRAPLSPPPTHLSTTNDIPMDSEVRTTREHIQVGRTRLSEIDQEIGFLERLLVARRSERQHVEDTIAQHLTIISPMRTLPYDILGEIFSYTLPRFWSTEMSLSSCVLTHVCRNWRNIVMFSLPMLWSNICIENDHDIPSLAIQLERSGSCPLTIHFSSTNISAFKLILDHSDRWHTINLRLKEEMIPLLDKAIGKPVSVAQPDLLGRTCIILQSLRERATPRSSNFLS